MSHYNNQDSRGIFVCGKIIKIHTIHGSNYTVIKLPRNGYRRPRQKKLTKNNSVCTSYPHNYNGMDAINGVGAGRAGGESALPKVLISRKSGQNTWKSGQSIWKYGQKWDPTFFDFEKLAPNVHKLVPNVHKFVPNVQNHMKTFFWRSSQKVCAVGGNIPTTSCSKTFQASLGKFGQKSFAPLNVCLLLSPMTTIDDLYRSSIRRSI